jgi:hypothetical protein
MPNARHAVKRSHEQFVVSVMIEQLNKRHRCGYQLIGEPDPPDAIIGSKARTSWIEVVDVFWTPEWAKDVISYATPGEVHKPVAQGLKLDMDNSLAERFAKAVQAKLEKTTYAAFRDAYGPGYLAVSMLSPFFSSGTLTDMRNQWNSRTFSDLGCFRSVYLVFSSMNKYTIKRWHY